MTHATPFKQEDATRLLVLAALVTEVTNDHEPVTRLLRTMHPVSKAHCIKSYAGRIFSLLTFAFSLSYFQHLPPASPVPSSPSLMATLSKSCTISTLNVSA